MAHYQTESETGGVWRVTWSKSNRSSLCRSTSKLLLGDLRMTKSGIFAFCNLYCWKSPPGRLNTVSFKSRSPTNVDNVGLKPQEREREHAILALWNAMPLIQMHQDISWICFLHFEWKICSLFRYQKQVHAPQGILCPMETYLMWSNPHNDWDIVSHINYRHQYFLSYQTQHSLKIFRQFRQQHLPDLPALLPLFVLASQPRLEGRSEPISAIQIPTLITKF